MKNLLAFVFVLILAVSFSSQTNSPEFTAVTIDGSKVDTAALRGKIVVLNLWFINCPNCVAEIKLLNEVVDTYTDNKDVVFLAPAASKRSDLVKFLVKNPFKFQVIPDAASIILGKFGTPAKNGKMNMPFPMHVVLDRDGMIVVKVPGTKGVEAVKNELVKQFAKVKAD